MSIQAKPGDTITLTAQSEAGDEDLFPQAIIYSAGGTVQSTTNLTHDQSGAYSGTVAAPDEGHYYVQYIMYTDAGHTTQSGVDPIISETLDVAHSGIAFGSVERGGGPNADEITKPILVELNKVLEKLDKKSEFQPSTDVVKTNLKMPDMEAAIKKINQIVVANKAKDYSAELQNIGSRITSALNAIQSIKFPMIPAPVDHTQELAGIENALMDNTAIEELATLVGELDSRFSEIKEDLATLNIKIPNKVSGVLLKTKLEK
jgi:hypothetical protein